MLGCPFDFLVLDHHRDEERDELEAESCQGDNRVAMIESSMTLGELVDEQHNQCETGHVAKNFHPPDCHLGLLGVCPERDQPNKVEQIISDSQGQAKPNHHVCCYLHVDSTSRCFIVQHLYYNVIYDKNQV